MGKFRKPKEEIRTQNKAKAKLITKEQQAGLLQQRTKEGAKDFLQKLASASGIQGVDVILWSTKVIKWTYNLQV